ncbi:MAG: glycogen/starch synthase [Gemmatimonadaceae bacterium]
MSAECWPYARTGGLGEAVSTLARHQLLGGQEAVVVMPLYRVVRDAYQLETVGEPFAVSLGGRAERVTVQRLTGASDAAAAPSVFFVAHADFTERAGLYGEDGVDYADNGRRFALFSAAALAALPNIAPNASVVHAHDWHAALTIAYLRTTFARSDRYRRLGAVLSVHNAAYQGHSGPDTLPDLGLAPTLYDWRWFEWFGRTNLLKGSLAFADMVTTVSPTHAEELRSELGGFGLHGTFLDLGDRLRGIVNGIDQCVWDPRTDGHLPARYSHENLLGKRRCKSALQEAFGLPVRADAPLVAMCARLTAQKGFDLLLESSLLRDHTTASRLRRDVQVAILGRGEERFARLLSERASACPDRVAVRLDFTDELEHLLMAGADMCLVPSLFEPCGLTQMRAQRYGAIPIAHRVGGLADTIDDGVSGFLFTPYAAPAFEASLDRSLMRFADTPWWRQMMRAAMRRDFGWARSVREYCEVYRRAVAVRTSSESGRTR